MAHESRVRNGARGLLAAALLSAAMAGEAAVPEEKVIYSPAYPIDRIYRSMEGPSSTRSVFLVESAEPELLWLTGVKTEMVGADGETPSLPEFMCHVNVDIDAILHRELFGGSKMPGTRVVTLSQGQLESRFPDGFALPLMSNEPLVLTTQVLNLNYPSIDAAVRHRVTFTFLRDCELGAGERPAPLFNAAVFGMALVSEPEEGTGSLPESEHGDSCLVRPQAPNAMGGSEYRDSSGRSFTGHWVVKPGVEENRTVVTPLLNLPFDTTLHHAAVHLHPYAKSLELRDVTANRTLFRSDARGPDFGLGLEEVTSFASAQGIRLYKDHEYELVSVYDNTSGRDQDSMAVMYLGLRDHEFFGPIRRGEPFVPQQDALPPAVFPEPVDGPRVVLETIAGPIELVLYPLLAPETVTQFLRLVDAGVYDSLRITRIEPGFVIQTGMAPVHRSRPMTAEQLALIRKIRLEASPLMHRRGTLSMAHWDGDRDSAETSFSIILGDAPHLDGNYTIFGRVESGWDAVEAIERAPVKYDSTEPAVEILIQSARSVRPDVQVTEK